MSRARNLANLGNKSTIIGINTTNRVGIGSTIPDTKLDVDGVVTATSFSGSGSGLTGLANTAFVNATQLNVIGVTTVGAAVTINSTGIDAVSGVITASSFVGNVTGNLTGQASALSGSRTIGGVVFDNTGNINLPGVNQSGTQNTSGTAGGLSGTPDITVGAITASNVNVSGITTVGILTAYESITVKVGTGSTELTTALSTKASTGKAIAMAMVFGF